MLIQLLRGAAAEVGDQTAIVTSTRTVTYRGLNERAESYARGIEARCLRRFGCVIQDPVELVALLCAASLTGSEACVYRPSVERPLATELASAFEHKVIVSDRRDIADGVEVVSYDELTASDGVLPEQAPQSPVLILTTGTTGLPKGARHEWGRLLSAVRRQSLVPGARWLLVYNLNQFAGVQVFLHALAGRATLIVPPSNQPQAALPFACEHRVTHISATPTFWRFTVALLSDGRAAELPIEQITLGGEAVPEALLDDLKRLFPRARLSQIYASTEAGSAVSVRDARHGLPVSVLARGDDSAVQMKIIDGELHVRSRFGMLGYHGSDDSSRDRDVWRATGDLVEVRDGRICFVGRNTEVINVGGVKVHPLPVEAAALTVPGVITAHAYGRPSSVAGQIVAVDVVAAPGADLEELEDAIRDACAQIPPAAQPRRIRFVAAIDIEDQKIVRRAHTERA